MLILLSPHWVWIVLFMRPKGAVMAGRHNPLLGLHNWAPGRGYHNSVWKVLHRQELVFAHMKWEHLDNKELHNSCWLLSVWLQRLRGKCEDSKKQKQKKVCFVSWVEGSTYSLQGQDVTEFEFSLTFVKVGRVLPLWEPHLSFTAPCLLCALSQLREDLSLVSRMQWALLNILKCKVFIFRTLFIHSWKGEWGVDGIFRLARRKKRKKLVGGWALLEIEKEHGCQT